MRVPAIADDELRVGDSFLMGRAVGHAAGQFGDFDNETLVRTALVDDESAYQSISKLV